MNDYQVKVPEGKSGDWEIKRFTVDEEAARREALRGMFNGGRFVPAGTYTASYRSGYLVMSDTPDEYRDHMYAVCKARGQCLVNGLGIGMVVQAMLKKPEVDHLTVIEISSDVISLVGGFYQNMFGDRIEIIEADALKWKPPRNVRYSCVWHDIWEDICSENLPDMHRLHRKYGRKCDWQGSWARGLCERMVMS